MTHPIAEILSQGEELVTGEIADTNAAWLSQELMTLGFDLTRHTAVGDRLDSLVDLLGEISRRADLCLCTGGLGPTCDDLTAEAVSRAFGLPLIMDATALSQIEAWFRRMNRDMPAVNSKQALLPQGATRLDNQWGTAPGFSVIAGRCRFYFLPGVPAEMKAMYRSHIQPQLPRDYALAIPQRVALRTIGLGESTLQERLNSLSLPPGTALGFRAGGSENQVKLTFPDTTPEPVIDTTLNDVRQVLGDTVYAITRNGRGPNSLIEVIGDALTEQNARLYLVETLSGGNMAGRCFGHEWLAGARLVTDPDWLLADSVHRPNQPLEQRLAALAEHLRQGEQVDLLLLQSANFTCVALADETARIELHTVIATRQGVAHECRLLSGTLQRKRDAATVHGLNLLRRVLLTEVPHH